MKRMTLIVVAALVVVVLPLCGRCSHEDHENRRQRVFDRASGHGPVTPSIAHLSGAAPLLQSRLADLSTLDHLGQLHRNQRAQLLRAQYGSIVQHSATVNALPRRSLGILLVCAREFSRPKWTPH